MKQYFLLIMIFDDVLLIEPKYDVKVVQNHSIIFINLKENDRWGSIGSPLCAISHVYALKQINTEWRSVKILYIPRFGW